MLPIHENEENRTQTGHTLAVSGPHGAAPSGAPAPGQATGAPAAIPFLEKLVARVESTRFDPAKPPPVEPLAFRLAGGEVAHSGSIVTIATAVRSGKSSVVSAIMALMMGTAGRDYLAIEGYNPDGKAVLHFDIEQSRGDHYHMMMRALRRADLQAPPEWFFRYSLTLLDPAILPKPAVSSRSCTSSPPKPGAWVRAPISRSCSVPHAP